MTDAMKESFELVTVFGQPMLFTDLRIDRQTVPKGLFMYEVRHGDDLGVPLQIEHRVFVNHFGTLISNMPISLHKSKVYGEVYRDIDPDQDWSSEGYFYTIQEYLEEYPPQMKERERDFERG